MSSHKSKIVPLIPDFSKQWYTCNEMSRSQFDHYYSTTKSDLADIRLPPCLVKADYYEPPRLFPDRPESVKPYLTLRHWENRKYFRHMVRKIRSSFGDLSVTVSIIHEDTVSVQFESGFQYTEIPRSMSLDAHAILSDTGFHLNDASQDWRSCKNPFVTNSPFIKSYQGVRLTSSSGVSIGVLAIFSSCADKIARGRVEHLSKFAARFMEHLETPYETLELERTKQLLNQYSKNDAELIELSAQLGRATSTDGHLTIFERDGSGSAYSGNRIFRLNSALTSSRHRHFLPVSLSMELGIKVKELNDETEVMMLLAKSVAKYEKVAFVCIIRVRTISDSDMNTQTTNDSLKLKTTKTSYHGRKSIRILAQSDETYQLSETDKEVWLRSSTSALGYTLRAHSDSIFNCGVTIPILGHVIEGVAWSKENLGDADQSAHSTKLVLGAFTKTGVFSASKVSRIYDHAQVYLEAFANR